MKIKPLCPGCGKPMVCIEPHLYVYETPESLKYICAYRCDDYKCGWIAPIGSGKTPDKALKNAFDKAVRRAKDENNA